MSTYNEYCGVVPIKPGITLHSITTAIRTAIGEQDQAIYFPIGDVITPGDNPLRIDTIDFGMIPPEGASAEIIERAMHALAPFVDTSRGHIEIEMVPGYNWGDAAMYRFIDGHVEISGASLCATGDWRLITPRH